MNSVCQGFKYTVNTDAFKGILDIFNNPDSGGAKLTYIPAGIERHAVNPDIIERYEIMQIFEHFFFKSYVFFTVKSNLL